MPIEGGPRASLALVIQSALLIGKAQVMADWFAVPRSKALEPCPGDRPRPVRARCLVESGLLGPEYLKAVANHEGLGQSWA